MITQSVDYYTVTHELSEILKLHLPIGVVVLHEEPIVFTHEMVPMVGVYHEVLEVPDGQPLAMGRVQREVMGISIWTWVFSVDIHDCIKQRSTLRKQVRDILMQHRTINDCVETMFEIGGNMASARVEGAIGYVAGAEIAIRAPLKTTV